MEMYFDELIEVWFPVAAEIVKTNGNQMAANMVKGVFGGK